MIKLRTVTARRYVTPLREGGSLPAIIEADDDGLYVLKFRGAGQGPKALIAELLAGELARTEPDPEIQSLIQTSAGLNIALDYLPGSVTFDPLVFVPDAQLASAIVWFDAFVCNVDRTVRNVNMLIWHRRLWLIDHGAALYFHHAWNRDDRHAAKPFALIKDHVLLGRASALAEVDARMTSLLTAEKLWNIIQLIPDSWLADDSGFANKAALREAYLNYFTLRVHSSRVFVQEAVRARS